MPGPPPKPAKLRQRRNRDDHGNELVDGSPLEHGKIPTLPRRRDELGHPIPWSREIRAWWRAIWTSPWASQYTRADVHELMDLARLKERQLQKPSAALAAEIRLQASRFGLDNMSRRRLRWEITSGDEERRRRTRTLEPTDPPPQTEDPRARLRRVK